MKFYVIEAQATQPMYLAKGSDTDKIKWTFNIKDATQFNREVDAEFERLSLGLRNCRVEEHEYTNPPNDKY